MCSQEKFHIYPQTNCARISLFPAYQCSWPHVAGTEMRIGAHDDDDGHDDNDDDDDDDDDDSAKERSKN